MIKQVVFIGISNVPSAYPNNILVKNKVYDVVFESSYMYYIANDIGGENSYVKDNFITLQEWRDNKLNHLLPDNQ